MTGRVLRCGAQMVTASFRIVRSRGEGGRALLGTSVFCLLFCGCEQRAEIRGPVRSTGGLAFDPPSLDFGALKPGSRVESSARLANRTDDVYVIERIRCSCECLTLEVPTRELQPRETVTCRVVLDLKAETMPGAQLRMTARVDGKGKGSIELTLDVVVLDE